METVGSFGAPAPASFSFRIEKDWSADHLFYAKALKQSEVDICQVCQVDLQGKPGHCVVTVKSSAEREKILDAGIRISGKASVTLRQFEAGRSVKPQHLTETWGHTVFFFFCSS